MKAAMSYDWSEIIEQLISSGHTTRTLSKALDMEMSERALAHYRRHFRNGQQPLYWRGECLLLFWCETFGKNRADAPQCEVRRGHRADRRLQPGPRMQDLPPWPPAGAVPVKRRGRPPRKMVEVA